MGFGGALTGSSAYLLNKMNTDLKQKVLATYFSKTIGLGFTFLRTSIGGCDFDLKPWAYNELPEHDINLSNFNKLDQRDLSKVFESLIFVAFIIIIFIDEFWENAIKIFNVFSRIH